MILFESSILRLDYTPATDVLVADLTNRHEFYALEVQEAFNIIVENVRHYDVKRLLMDSRNRVLLIDDALYTTLLADFSRGLQTTRLQKVARLHTGVPAREDIVENVNERVIVTYTLRTFQDKAKALEWLMAK